VLPRPAQPFQGIAKRTLEGSEGAFTQPVKAPPNAPNILLVLIDDAGFGNPSTFGGPVATPTLDKLAAEGPLQSISVTATLDFSARGFAVGEPSCRDSADP
jgi:arylsulfatase